MTFPRYAFILLLIVVTGVLIIHSQGKQAEVNEDVRDDMQKLRHRVRVLEVQMIDLKAKESR